MSDVGFVQWAEVSEREFGASHKRSEDVRGLEGVEHWLDGEDGGFREGGVGIAIIILFFSFVRHVWVIPGKEKVCC